MAVFLSVPPHTDFISKFLTGSGLHQQIPALEPSSLPSQAVDFISNFPTLQPSPIPSQAVDFISNFRELQSMGYGPALALGALVRAKNSLPAATNPKTLFHTILTNLIFFTFP